MKRSNKNRRWAYLTSLMGLLVFLVACGQSKAPEVTTTTSQEALTVATTEEPKTDRSVTIRSVGDILLHDTVYWNGDQGDGTYNFDAMFEPVKAYLQNADITTANMETIVAGSDFGLSTYPFFNAPSEIVDTLQRVGVDIVSNSTNHTMDWGAEGALASIKAIKARHMLYVGSYESWDDYNTPRIIEVNGVKVGFLDYTFGLNGNYLPEDQAYLATLIDNELIDLEIRRLKKFCDIAVVIYQVGEENDFYPSPWQEEVFQVAKDAGANLVLGGHPHVLQPGIIWNDHQAGIYSHGNFLSGQYTEDQKVGAIWEFTFKVDAQDKVTFEKMRLMPTYNIGLPEFQYYSVIPLADAGDLGVIDVPGKFAQLEERMHTYNDAIEVVDYLD